MPSLSICKNSARAAANFSPSNSRKREVMGVVVLMKCFTSPEDLGRTLEAFNTSGNAARTASNLFPAVRFGRGGGSGSGRLAKAGG